MSIQTRYRHTLVIKGMVATTGGAAETVGGADTTLTADTAIGDLVVHVAATTGMTAGDWLRVGDTGEAEVRQVAVGGIAALAVTLTAPLAIAHDSGDQVREVDDAGTTSVDDYGQPVTVETTLGTVPGLVQPRRGRETNDASQAGAALGDHVGYMDLFAGLTTEQWVEVSGERYDITFVPDAGGVGHHLELGLKKVS